MGPRKKQSPAQRQADMRQRMQVARFQPDSVVQGSFNQSSGLLTERNRGSQCTCMSLMALVTAQQKPPNQWSMTDLDGVLLEGDELYDRCRGERTFLLTTELPSTVSRVGQTYSMRYHNGFCGTLGRLLSDAPFYTLHDAIISAQRVSRMNFLLIGTASVSSACLVMNLGGQHGCYVFDSHSRNQHGMSGADGTSVLLKLSNLEMVSQYAQSLAASMKLGSHHQFEVVPCSLRLNSQTGRTPGFYAPLEQYVQQQEQQQQRYRESQEPSTTKTANSSIEQRLSKPSVKEMRREREREYRSRPEVNTARKLQRAEYDANPHVKQVRATRETVQRQEPVVKRTRKIQREQHDKVPDVKQARVTRETVQRQEPVVKRTRKIQREQHDKVPDVKQARVTRETVQRQEPVVKRTRKIQREQHDKVPDVKQARATRETVQRQEPVVRQARATRETVQRQEPVVKRTRKIQREQHDKVPDVKQARATRETVQRQEPVVKRTRKIQREQHDKVPDVKQARATRETVQRQEPVVKRTRKIQREQHDKVPDVKQARATREVAQRQEPEVRQARATRETVQRQEPVVKRARTTREHNYNAMSGFKEKKKQQREEKQDKERDMQKDIRTVLNNFETKCGELPKFTCCVCERFRFRSQVEKFKADKYQANRHTLEQCKIPRSDNTGCWICLPCHKSLKKDKVPVLSVHGNNLKPIEMPGNLNELNTLEQFLITPVLPFMKIISLPKGSQQGMHGPVVCVAADIKKTVERLPRPIDDSGLIKVKLKRKLAYRGHHLHQQVRINLVADALHFLKQHHPTLKGDLSNILPISMHC